MQMVTLMVTMTMKCYMAYCVRRTWGKICILTMTLNTTANNDATCETGQGRLLLLFLFAVWWDIAGLLNISSDLPSIRSSEAHPSIAHCALWSAFRNIAGCTRLRTSGRGYSPPQQQHATISYATAHLTHESPYNKPTKIFALFYLLFGLFIISVEVEYFGHKIRRRNDDGYYKENRKSNWRSLLLSPMLPFYLMYILLRMFLVCGGVRSKNNKHAKKPKNDNKRDTAVARDSSARNSFT